VKRAYLSGLDALAAPLTVYRPPGRIVFGAVDVDGLVQRFAELPHTNDMARRIWAEHGYPLAQRTTRAAQDIIAKAVLPSNEFTWHDQVMAYAARAKTLGPKISALPLNDTICPYWDELESYVVDGARLVNALEGALAGSVTWEDVKSTAASAAASVKSAVDTAQTTAKWTIGLAVAGVGLILFGVYKIAAGPTGQTAVGAFLGRGR
jgi:hypothetical protein